MIKANEAKAVVERVIKERAEEKKLKAKEWCEETSEKILRAAKEECRSLVVNFPFELRAEIVDILTMNGFDVKQLHNQFKFEILW